MKLHMVVQGTVMFISRQELLQSSLGQDIGMFVISVTSDCFLVFANSNNFF